MDILYWLIFWFCEKRKQNTKNCLNMWRNRHSELANRRKTRDTLPARCGFGVSFMDSCRWNYVYFVLQFVFIIVIILTKSIPKNLYFKFTHSPQHRIVAHLRIFTLFPSKPAIVKLAISLSVASEQVLDTSV